MQLGFVAMDFKKLLPFIGLIILIFIIATLDLKEICAVFSTIDPFYSFLSFFSVFPVVFLSNVQWQILLKKQKIRVSFLYSLKNIFIGYFYGFITPGGIGAYTRSFYLSNESKTPLPKCVSNIIVFNTIDYLSLLLLGAIGGLFLSSISFYLFLTIITILIIVVALLLFFLKKEKSKPIFTKIVKSKIFATISDHLTDSVDSFYEDLPSFRDIILPFSISLFGWVVRSSILFLIARMFSVNVPFFYFILIIAVANVVASIPVTIYGLGTREAALISMFSVFNVIPEKILALSLFWFAVIWLFPSVIGAFVTAVETKKLNKSLLRDITIERFTKYMKKYPELYENLAVIVKKNIPRSVKKPYIVDLGCGPGLLSLEISKKIPKARIIGVDPSVKMLETANKNIKQDNFQTRIGKSDKLPIENNSVDIVVSRFSLTYWDKPKDSFTEINRVLKPGGRVVLEALNKDFSKWRLFLIKIHMFFKGAGGDVVRYHIDAYKTAYSVDSVKKLLTSSGFKITYTEGVKEDWKFIFTAKKK